MLGSNAFQDIAAEIGQYMFLWLFSGHICLSPSSFDLLIIRQEHGSIRRDTSSLIVSH